MWRLMIFPLLLFAHRACATKRDSFCNVPINPDPTAPSISKDLNAVDIGYLTKYKSLHCCARDFDTIEWVKDGEPLLPQHSTFHVSENEKNQTIESIYLQHGDQGNYTCVVRNNLLPQPKVFTITLQVAYVNSSPGRPIITHKPSDQYALLGGTAKFYCEAMIGYGEVVKSAELYWAPYDEQLRFAKNNSNIMVLDVQRDNHSVIGSFLIFQKVTEKDYGCYICHITNNVEEPYNLNACLRYGDDKEFDVFVCYDEQDSDFAVDVLVATLENSYGYRCFAYQRDSLAGDWIPETYANAVKKSHRFLMVLSPALATNNWCIYALYIAIEALLNLHSKIICVELQNISWDVITTSSSNVNDTTLRHVLNVIKKVRWDPGCTLVTPSSENACLEVRDFHGNGSETFWKKLRLHLPPRRTFNSTTICDTEEAQLLSEDSVLSSIDGEA